MGRSEYPFSTPRCDIFTATVTRLPFGERETKEPILIPRMLSLALFLTTLAVGQPRHIVAISHRGEHLHHPENTMPAFEEAIRVGADFIEVDVQTTADGKLVLSHDGTVNRCTNGEGRVAGNDLRAD